MKNKLQKGFTLIELLVVIAIIGLLSSVVLASLNTARLKSRNATRIADLIQLRNALELYKTDNGAYPSGGWYGYGSCAIGGSTRSGSSGWVPNLAPTYISTLPIDPQTPAPSTGCFMI